MLKPDLAQLKGVIYDLDGVLIHSANAWFRVINEGSQRFGGPEIPADVFLKTFGQGPVADRDRFFPQQSLEEVSHLYIESFPLHLDAVEVANDAENILKILGGEKGLKQGVVTNTPLALARQTLERIGLLPYLNTLAASGEAVDKPAPDLIHLCLKRLELQSNQVVYIGDSESDRLATLAAKVRMIGIGHPGDWQVSSLREAADLLLN